MSAGANHCYLYEQAAGLSSCKKSPNSYWSVELQFTLRLGMVCSLRSPVLLG